MKRLMLLMLVISLASEINAKGVKTPEYKKYQSYAGNAGWVKVSTMAYQINFVTPRYRSQVYDYSSYKVNSKIKKEKKKFKNKPEKLKEELSERQYREVVNVEWDKPKDDIVLLAIPHLIPAQNTPIRNRYQARSIEIHDKDGNIVCKPQSTFSLKKNAVYAHLTQIYDGKFYYKNKGKRTTYDSTFSPILARFPVKCFDNDELYVFMNSAKKVTASGKISKKVLKQVRADYKSL
jgi:hypothetical protein